jgi:hypothetical protein
LSFRFLTPLLFLCFPVVHQSHIELGIEPVFWQDGADAQADEPHGVLPMVRRPG